MFERTPSKDVRRLGGTKVTVNLSTSAPLKHSAIAAIALLACTAVLVCPAVAQTHASDAGDWEAPRTVHGHPDLQGNWTNATLTPLQRPEGWAPVLTWDKVSELETGQAELVALTNAPSDPDRAPPPAGGTNPICIDSGTSCYNEVYRDPGDRVAIVSGEPRSSLVMNPSDGRVPQMTSEARQRIADEKALRSQFGPYDHPELRPNAERCLVSFGSSAGPPMLPNYWYNNNYTIVQNADYVMIMAEMVHDVRIIRLGEADPLRADLRPWFGDSRGWYEGNTLVVETTNINSDQQFLGAGPSADRKVTERFTRVDDETLLYEFTIDDPSTYESAWGGQIPFKVLDGQIYEYACHEGNYALAGVLSGARYQERTEGGR